MRSLAVFVASSALVLGAGRALAEDAPPPAGATAPAEASTPTPPAPAPTATPPAPVPPPPAPVPAPMPPPPPPMMPPVAESYPVGPANGPCCFQRRDACGCAIDSCGNRYGKWDISLEGTVSWISSPDGILGETLFIPGHQLNWDNVDYGGEFGGRATIAYHPSCLTRVELRGTYYGNPDGNDTDAGFFALRPGNNGLGDISRPVNADFHADAELWGIELNGWTELACRDRWRFDAGLGVRYLSLNETARAGLVTTGPGVFPVAD